MSPMERKPAPGSSDARNMGCTCPVDENREGEGVAHMHDEHGAHFCVAKECPVHGFES